MNEEAFLKEFASLYPEVEPAAITIETQFKNIEGWDSLVALSLIAMVDEKYKVKLGGADIQKAQSIRDLYSLVESRIAG